MRLKHYEIAGLKSFDLQVVKPNLTFGLKPSSSGSSSSLWTRFDKDSRLTIERLEYKHWEPTF